MTITHAGLSALDQSTNLAIHDESSVRHRMRQAFLAQGSDEDDADMHAAPPGQFELQSMFEDFDEDSNGRLSLEEVRHAVAAGDHDADSAGVATDAGDRPDVIPAASQPAADVVAQIQAADKEGGPSGEALLDAGVAKESTISAALHRFAGAQLGAGKEAVLTLVMGPITMRVRLLAAKVAAAVVLAIAIGVAALALRRRYSHSAWCRAAGFEHVAQKDLVVVSHAGQDEIDELATWLQATCQIRAAVAHTYAEALAADGYDSLKAVATLEEGDVPDVIKKGHRKLLLAGASDAAATQRERAVSLALVEPRSVEPRAVEPPGQRGGLMIATAHFEDVKPGKLRVHMAPLDRSKPAAS